MNDFLFLYFLLTTQLFAADMTIKFECVRSYPIKDYTTQIPSHGEITASYSVKDNAIHVDFNAIDKQILKPREEFMGMMCLRENIYRIRRAAMDQCQEHFGEDEDKENDCFVIIHGHCQGRVRRKVQQVFMLM